MYKKIRMLYLINYIFYFRIQWKESTESVRKEEEILFLFIKYKFLILVSTAMKKVALKCEIIVSSIFRLTFGKRNNKQTLGMIILKVIILNAY